MRGLRGRAAAALAVITLATLGIISLALLTPLEGELRAQEIETVVQAARDNVKLVERLDSSDFTPSNPKLRRRLRTIRRLTEAEVTVVDARGRTLATTSPDPESRYPYAIAVARGGKANSGNERSGPNDVARAVVAVNVDDLRYGMTLRKPIDDATKAAAVVRRNFVIAAIIGLLVAMLLGVVLSSGLTRRIRGLRDTALRVAEIGPVAELQIDTHHDEIGDLSRAFAEMQTRLREQEQARKSFVATASHELRTPLASLLVMIDLLRGSLEEPTDVPDARVQAERAELQAERLSDLAADLLDLSRIDARVPLRSELVELGSAASVIAGEFEARAGAAGLGVVTALADGVWAVADPGAITQILRILVDNAIRFAPSGSEIRVELVQDADGPSVAVVDAGPGVAVGDRERIFERFERSGDASSSAGFGLGLAIGRELAQQMGGDLRLDPEAAGGRFVLRLRPAPAV